MVACVVVEVKVQQRRPDGGSIPPIARIDLFALLLLCQKPWDNSSFELEKLAENFDAGLEGGLCATRLWGLHL